MTRIKLNTNLRKVPSDVALWVKGEQAYVAVYPSYQLVEKKGLPPRHRRRFGWLAFTPVPPPQDSLLVYSFSS